MENIFKKRAESLNTLTGVVKLLQCKNNIQTELEDLCCNINNLNRDLKHGEEFMEHAKNKMNLQHILLKLQHLEQSFYSITENSQFEKCISTINSSDKPESKTVVAVDSRNEDIKNHSNNNVKKSRNESKVEEKEYIPLINEKEFKSIPAYIIGRNSIAVLNNFVNTLNRVFNVKYNFLALGQSKARKTNQLGKYFKYRSEATHIPVLKGREYITEDDYIDYTQVKLDKIKLNFLSALRYLKRIERIQNGKDLYYASIKNDKLSY